MIKEIPKYNIPLLLAYLYVFFNVFMLPNGLYYTILVSPVFLYNTIRSRYYLPYFSFAIIAAVFSFIHTQHALNIKDYLRSNLLMLLNLTFLVTCYGYFKQANDEHINSLFKKVTYFNFIMVLIAVVCFFIPFLKPVFWYLIPITEGSGIVPRLKMLWSEASIYSLMLSPFCLYFFFYRLLIKKSINFSFLLLLVVPLLLSNSMGVCICLAIAVATTVIFFKKIFLSAELFNQLLLGLILIFSAFAVWYWVDKNNVFFLRIHNIVSGHDTSAKGRTIDAFIIAKKVLNQYDCWWTGIGPGQFKILGKQLLLDYYQYGGNVADIRIPNACADTLIVYGLIGLVFRISVLILLFFTTKVYGNIFRFSLFVFLFTYQFTGSYFNNLIEWTLWVIVFSDAFLLFRKPTTSK